MLYRSFSKNLHYALFLLVLSACLAPLTARADGYFGGNPERAPSVFTYGWRGLLTGTAVGVSGGYLAARKHGYDDDDWRPLVLGGGAGALSGAAVGLTLGFVDLASERPGHAAIALRDSLYGAGFGAVLGLVIGSLVIIRTEDAEHALFGSAIGTLAGTGFGLVIGLIEGRRIVQSPQHARRGRVMARLFGSEDAEGRLVLGPGLVGTF